MIDKMLPTATIRMMDASLNRASEGLRVIEDFHRFVRDDRFLTGQLKDLRHDLANVAATLPPFARAHARDTVSDVGTDVSTGSERERMSELAVCEASFKRVAQALRSLEEYGKLIDADLGAQFESLRYRLYTLEKVTAIGTNAADRLADTRLMVLIDGCKSLEAFAALVSELVDAGTCAIQLRDKRLEDRDLLERAKTLRALTRCGSKIHVGARGGLSARAKTSVECPAGQASNGTLEGSEPDSGAARTLFIVNDRPDIALLASADAVHLGQEDLAVKDARAIVGADMLIGVSTHNLEQVRAAVLAGADYLGAGPTFSSTTKEFADLAGLDYLLAVAAETSLPVFAIGGIGTENVGAVLETGVTRAAVAAAVTAAEDPGVAASTLIGMLEAPAIETSKHST